MTNYICPQWIAETLHISTRCIDEFVSPRKSSRLPVDNNTSDSDVIAVSASSCIRTLRPDFVTLLDRSCLKATINHYLLNDSGEHFGCCHFCQLLVFVVLDISRHVVVYEAVIGLILAMCSCVDAAATESSADEGPKSSNNMSGAQLAHFLMSNDEHGGGLSITERLTKLLRCVEIYTSKLTRTDARTAEAMAASAVGDTGDEVQQEENLDDLLRALKEATALLINRKSFVSIMQCF